MPAAAMLRGGSDEPHCFPLTDRPIRLQASCRSARGWACRSRQRMSKALYRAAVSDRAVLTAAARRRLPDHQEFERETRLRHPARPSRR
ncbi:hypothetical protein ACRAWF_20510 [Streptomyces sp. L7]